MSSLTDEQIRDAVSSYASDHCCYGNDVSKNMDIKSFEGVNVFRYTLQTFCEKRETGMRFEPYDGQHIDGPENGPAPGPWDITVRRPWAFFIDDETRVEVPHTAFVKTCDTCYGTGSVDCSSCSGSGRTSCSSCGGSGTITNSDNDRERCTSCSGDGYSRCWSCSGSGQQECGTCDGKKRLKHYKQLTVTWTNHVTEYISETFSLPMEKIRKVTGDVIFQEEALRLSPISHSVDESVNMASYDLINAHRRGFRNEQILRQKHHLNSIPLTYVVFEFKGRIGDFYVFGLEDKVHFRDYPQNCCCCCHCTIL